MAHKRAALVISVVASGCVLLVGCGGSNGSNNSGSSAAGPMKKATNDSSTSAGSTSGTGVRLTGDFCSDFKNIGQNVKIPGDAQGSLSTLQKQVVNYLVRSATYFTGLADEAPAQAENEFRLIAKDYQAIAESVYQGNIGSLSKIEKQMESLASGDAFRQMVSSVTTKCMSA
jgi:hypothetical protein